MMMIIPAVQTNWASSRKQ